jgi:hypothetical protein
VDDCVETANPVKSYLNPSSSKNPSYQTELTHGVIIRGTYYCKHPGKNFCASVRKRNARNKLEELVGQIRQLIMPRLTRLCFQVVKMMMVVVIIFAVCWLPYHLYFIVISYFPEITSSTYIQETYLAIYWLAMSNSMYNPIIYCWMNAR